MVKCTRGEIAWNTCGNHSRLPGSVPRGEHYGCQMCEDTGDTPVRGTPDLFTICEKRAQDGGAMRYTCGKLCCSKHAVVIQHGRWLRIECAEHYRQDEPETGEILQSPEDNVADDEEQRSLAMEAVQRHIARCNEEHKGHTLHGTGRSKGQDDSYRKTAEDWQGRGRVLYVIRCLTCDAGQENSEIWSYARSVMQRLWLVKRSSILRKNTSKKWRHTTYVWMEKVWRVRLKPVMRRKL